MFGVTKMKEKIAWWVKDFKTSVLFSVWKIRNFDGRR